MGWLGASAVAETPTSDGESSLSWHESKTCFNAVVEAGAVWGDADSEDGSFSLPAAAEGDGIGSASNASAKGFDVCCGVTCSFWSRSREVGVG